MPPPLRLSEKWFHRGLWLIAVLFAYFLTGLGATVVEDLPKIENRLSVADFTDRAAHTRLTERIQALNEQATRVAEQREQARLLLQAAQADHQTAQQAFAAWVSTRTATQRTDRDPDLIARTTELERLQRQERTHLAAVEALQKQWLDATQARDQAQREQGALEAQARARFDEARQHIELRVFGYRLAFVLPLLLVSAHLFVKHRKTSYWPFVWGFILFSLVAFFVELVPYLPSYGGYVRYTVGVIVTLVVGRHAMAALQRYLERQRALEGQADAQHPPDIGHDLALSRIGKGICPRCERPVQKEHDNFCPHCGLGLFLPCGGCGTRRATFARFCFHCGAPSGAGHPPAQKTPSGG